MSRWLTLALTELSPLANAHGPPVPIVPIVPKPGAGSNFGTNGTNGTAPPIEIEERIAMALEGGVPALYAEAFAAMQVTCPTGVADSRWQQAVDDAGCFLDAHGAAAAALGWGASDLFSSGGLVWALAGQRVTSLSSSAAGLSDGRIRRR